MRPGMQGRIRLQIHEEQGMAAKIFVNLPVSDLKRSKAFFSSLGYTFNAQFTDDTAACMVVSDDIFVMLLTNPKFKSFTPKEICDATKSTERYVPMTFRGWGRGFPRAEPWDPLVFSTPAQGAEFFPAWVKRGNKT